MRVVYLLLGLLLVGLGILGIFLPGLPTTPLMLLALWMFARSSKRLHQWLYHHPRFGPPLQRWKEHRVIPLKAKVMSGSMMALSFGYLLFFRDSSLWLLLVVGAVMAYGLWFVCSKPSQPPS
ncbi:MAG: YbaN family protein [Verrucomicrobiota bacterium]